GRSINRAVISVHCHNALGMAVANSLTAVMEGARQVECTINGIGERAGNAALEEIVMAVRTRGDYFGVSTQINTRKQYPTSPLVKHVTRVPGEPHKGIIPQQAFSHQSGHNHGRLLTERST